MLTSRSCARLLSALVAATAVLAADPSPVVAREATDVFPQPEDRRSTDGVLRTTLRVAITPTTVVDWPRGVSVAVETSTYEGTIPGPTLRVKPGDVLEIDLPNDLPHMQHGRAGAFPHDATTMNLHTHGLAVSPRGFGDNVLREMAPGTVSPVRIKIPEDHPSGTFWYHPHKHGAVTYQMFGGMAGFLIVEGGPGTLDAVPEVKAARDVVMGFQVVRVGADGKVPFVNQEATQFGTNPVNPLLPAGLWSTLVGSNSYVTTNGMINPVLHMRPGEVQRWRLLSAGSGETFVVALQEHALNLVANDGITAPAMQTLRPGDPLVLGAGQRADVLVKAGAPGTYLLQAFDSGAGNYSVISGSGIDPRPRQARISFDTPPAPYPVTLATIVVSGPLRDMRLPSGPLPVPSGVQSIATMLSTPPDRVRRVAFENCGDQRGIRTFPLSMEDPTMRLPSCGWFYDLYGVFYWGGAPFTSLLMMRDADDDGVPNPSPNPSMPRVAYRKEGLFTADKPLFEDTFVGNFEEWTIINRAFTDHSFHMHQNPVLVTHVNGQALDPPQWRDVVLIPGAIPQPDTGVVNINTATFGTVRFRTFFAPGTDGAFVMHCHMIQHEDIGMMQRVELLPRP
jgi:FtsP/CotA-like multicopper oxidase with cupredoxin domain